MSYAEDRSTRCGMTRCPGCPGAHPPIPGDGPRNARVMLVGEKPGKEENSRGRCFIGQTGRELNDHYLPLAGLSREGVYVTNAVKCFSNDSASPELVRSCAEHHLRREIEAVRPDVIVPMGGVACSAVEGVNLEMMHGTPLRLRWWGREIDAFPMWHPARGLHETRMMLPLRSDFINLGRFLRGELDEVTDQWAGSGYPIYTEAADPEDVESEMALAVPDAPIAIDTESDPETGMWCLSASWSAGSAFVIRRANKECLGRFGEIILQWFRGPLIFHNGLYDLPVLEQASIRIPMRRFDDTMIRAYHLGHLPQSLKHLAYRLCGMQMKEYEDVVTPYVTDRMLAYVLELQSVIWPEPEEQLINSGRGVLRIYRPQGLNAKLKRLLTDYSKSLAPATFKRWDDWSMEEKLPAIKRFGDMPKPSIAHVPLEEAVHYACRDADATLRVWHKLNALKRFIRRPAIS